MGAITIQVKTDAATAKSEFAGVGVEARKAKEAAKGLGDELKKAVGGPAMRDAVGTFKATSVSVVELKSKVGQVTTASEQFNARMRASIVNADILRQKVDPLAASFGKLAEQIAREQQVLERLRGPIAEAKLELMALQKLHERGAITTHEYVAEVDRLNAALLRTPAAQGGRQSQGNASQAARTVGFDSSTLKSANMASMGGGGPTGMSAIAGAAPKLMAALGPIGLIVGAVLGAVHALTSFADAYVEVANKAQKLVRAGESVDDVLRTQIALSDDLHSSLNQTIELTDAIRDGTDDLNLTLREQEDLIRGVGSAVRLSGKDLGQAGGLVNTLSFAMANGTISGRELKGVMKEYPDIAQMMTESTGKTRKELIKLANDGKFSGQQLIDTFTQAGDALQGKLSDKTETAGQQWQHFKDKITLSFGKLITSTGILEKLGEILTSLAETVKMFSDTIGKLGGSFGGLANNVDKNDGPLGKFISRVKSGGAIKLLVDTIGDLKDALDTDTRESIRNSEAKARLWENYNKLTQVMEDHRRVSQTLAAMQRAGTAGGLSFDADVADRWSELKVVMGDVGIAMPEIFTNTTSKVVSLTVEIDKLRENKAMQKQADEAKKLWKEMDHINDVIDEGDKKFSDAVDRVKELQGAVDDLAKSRKFLTDAYAMAGKYGGDALATTRQEVEVSRELRDAKIELANATDRHGKTVAEAKIKTAQHKDALDDVHGAFQRGKLTVKEYTEALRALGVEEDFATKLLKQMNEPMVNWTKTIGALNLLLARGRITTGQYNDELLKLMDTTKAAGDNPLFGGVGEKKMGGLSLAVGFQKDVKALDKGKSISDDLPLEGIKFSDQLTESMQRQREVMEKILGPEKQYKQALADIAELYQQNSITLAESNALTRQAADAYKQARVPLQHVVTATEKWNAELDRLRASGQDDVLRGMKNGMNEVKSSIDVAAQSQKIITDGWGLAQSALTDMVTSGRDGFASLEASGRKMVQVLLAEMTKLLLFKALATAGFGAAGAGMPPIPGFASGGMIRPGGYGGTDSQIVAFRKSPDETVRITTPPQERALTDGGGRDRAPAIVNVVNIQDPDQIPAGMDSRRGRRQILNTMQSSRRTIRGTVTRT